MCNLKILVLCVKERLKKLHSQIAEEYKPNSEIYGPLDFDFRLHQHSRSKHSDIKFEKTNRDGEKKFAPKQTFWNSLLGGYALAIEHRLNSLKFNRERERKQGINSLKHKDAFVQLFLLNFQLLECRGKVLIRSDTIVGFFGGRPLTKLWNDLPGANHR